MPLLLENQTHSYWSINDTDDGVDGVGNGSGSGVLAMNGQGVIDFTSQAKAIDTRAQQDLVFRDCSNAVVLILDAYRLNQHLHSEASFDATDDKWFKNDGSGAAYNDFNLSIPFSLLQSTYIVSHEQAEQLTQQNNDPLNNYFFEFVNTVKNEIIVNGGDVLFTDETLIAKPFTSEDVRQLMMSANAVDFTSTDNLNPAMDALGSGGDATDAFENNNNDSTPITGSTSVLKGDSDNLEIVGLNKQLRRMVDIGYNNRAASGSGQASGSGIDGLISSNPFIEGDVLYFADGFSMDAQVAIEPEFTKLHQQLIGDEDGDEDGGLNLPDGFTVDATNIDGHLYKKQEKTANLFIQLV